MLNPIKIIPKRVCRPFLGVFNWWWLLNNFPLPGKWEVSIIKFYHKCSMMPSECFSWVLHILWFMIFQWFYLHIYLLSLIQRSWSLSLFKKIVTESPKWKTSYYRTDTIITKLTLKLAFNLYFFRGKTTKYVSDKIK